MGELELIGFVGSFIVSLAGFAQIGISWLQRIEQFFVAERCNTLRFILESNRVDSFKQFGGAIIYELPNKKGIGTTQLTT